MSLNGPVYRGLVIGSWRQAYKSWYNCSLANSSVLWIHGPPGFGKTVLSARIIKSLSEDVLRSVFYFFCIAGADSKYNPWSIVRSWVYQAVIQNETVAALVEKNRDRLGLEATITQLWQMLGNLVPKIPRAVFLIAGFDECSNTNPNSRPITLDAQAYFLRELMEFTCQNPIRLAMVSRDNVDIRSSLLGTSRDQSRITLFEYKITQVDTVADVSLFSKAMVQSKVSANTPAKVKQEIAAEAAEKSEGMFLWLKLLGNEWSAGKSINRLKKTLKEMPNGIEAAYGRDLEKIIASNQYDRDRAVAMLKWVMFAEKPLTIRQLVEAIAVSTTKESTKYPFDELPDFWTRSPEIDEAYINEVISGLCSSLVEVREVLEDDNAEVKLNNTGDEIQPLTTQTVHFVHFSAKEYLQNLETHKQSHFAYISFNNLALQQGELAMDCLRYLCLDIFDDEAMLEDKSIEIYPFHDYASEFWQRHATAARDSSIRPDIVSQAKILYRMEKSNWIVYANNSGGSNAFNFFNYADILNGFEIIIRMIDLFQDSLDWSDSTQPTRKGKVRHRAENEQQDRDIFLAKLFDDGKINSRFRPYGWLISDSLRGDCETQDIPSARELFKNFSAICDAATAGLIELVDMFVSEGSDINECSALGTPFSCCISIQETGFAAELIKRGADVSIKAGFNHFPLLNATAMSSVGLVELILQNGGDANCVDINGRSSLHYACLAPSEDVENPIKILLREGADVNLRSERGDTALAVACFCGYQSFLRILLDHGANPNLAAYGEWTPLHIAAFNGHNNVIQLLLEYGADIDAPGPMNISVLHCAVKSNRISTVQLLLFEGAKVNCATNSSNLTPLILAVAYRSKPIVDALISAKASVSLADRNGDGPLHAALTLGYYDIAESLIHGGAILHPGAENKPLLSLFRKRSYMMTENDFAVFEKYSHWFESAPVLDLPGMIGFLLIKCDTREYLEAVSLFLRSSNKDLAQEFLPGEVIMICLRPPFDSTLRLEKIRLLWENGFRFEDALSGHLVLQTLASNVDSDSLAIANALITYGAQVHSQGVTEGETPLSILSRSASPYAFELAKFLLKNGADVNVVGAENSESSSEPSPLTSAIMLKPPNIDFIRLLLESGADVHHNFPNKGGVLEMTISTDAVEVLRSIVEFGAIGNIHGDTFKNFSLLAEASIRNSTSILSYLIGEGVDVERSGEGGRGRAPIQLAVENGSEDAAVILLDAGCNIISQKRGLDDLLFRAVEQGMDKLVSRLFEQGADVDGNFTVKEPLLVIACRQGSASVVELLLNNGADILEPDIYGRFSLHVAVMNGHLECARVVLQYGGEVNRRTLDGATALHIAAGLGYLEILTLLLECGADIHAMNESIHKPIHFAILNDNALCLGPLLRAGSLDQRDINQLEPLLPKVVATFGSTERQEYKEIVTLLIGAGARINLVDTQGFTALLHAVFQNQVEVARLLLVTGANPNTNTTHTPPLVAAVQMRYLEMAEAILENQGTDLGITDKDGRSAVWYAISSRDPKMVELLLRYDILYEDERPPPLVHAIRIGSITILKLGRGLKLRLQTKTAPRH